MNKLGMRLLISMVIILVIILQFDLNVSAAEEPASGSHGSGSYQLNEVENDYRYYTEYYVEAASGKSITTADVLRRTSINVYAKKGEIILFGSSVSNSEIDENNVWKRSVTGTDIVITKPNKQKVCADVLAPGQKDKDNKVRPNGLGYIANPTQEKNGPMVNHTDETEGAGQYYVPLQYVVEEDGIYTFEFHSIRGYNDGSVPKPVLAKDKSWQQGTTSVAAWDVTVLGTNAGKWEVKEGRAWADYLALTTGDAGTKISDLNVHVLTHDGYVYKVDFEKAVPYGFIFFANNTGFMTTVSDDDGNVTKRPIYHSFYDSTNDLDHMSDGENIILHKPNEEDTATEETYKIFFNPPSNDLNAIGIKTKPDNNVELTGLKFYGIGNNLAHAGHGGYFSFNSDGEAMVTIRLDLRKAIFESELTIDKYEGSGIVEITAPAKEGANSFYWDGKDTDGIALPTGIYGNLNVVLSTEIKRGELHFPVIDMEGLYGGLHIERLNKSDTETAEHLSESAYNLYYNNNPLVYGTIEGSSFSRITKSNYDYLTDGTRSFAIDGKKGGFSYFSRDLPFSISTLVKDDPQYLAKKLFNSDYALLSPERKAIIDAEFGTEADTYHFEAVDSRTTSMKFSCSNYNGGGNQAGVDAWTYYSQGVNSEVISFAVMDSADRGIVSGQIFYDVDKNSTFTEGTDYWLPNMKVRLVDMDGNPLTHVESMPCFDKSGHFIYNEDGSIHHEPRTVTYESTTDETGSYKFIGVPYNPTEDTSYYVQVMLSDVQTEVLRYTCTTSEEVRSKLKTSGDEYFLSGLGTIDPSSGADGNRIVATTDLSKRYGYIYERDTETNETIFDIGNADNTQLITFSSSAIHVDANGIRSEHFKPIGYSTTVPQENRKDYMVTKRWGTDCHGNETHAINDGLIVELWVWNDGAVQEEHTYALNRRTGALMDTQVLNADNEWKYTWENLDDRLQYFVLEYYTKKKDNGEIIYNDKHEPRKVLIGGTMPIFGEVKAGHDGYYDFTANLGDYPEQSVDPSDPTKILVPIQSFGDGGTHTNSITKTEKLESVDNNARQYDVSYTLTQEVAADGHNLNVITITNSQVFDDRTYYVWLNHQTKLPDLIAETFVEDSVKKSHAITLEMDKQLEGDEYSIKGLSVSSMDAAESDNSEGNATNAFRLTANGTSALFTATKQTYKSGTGTRTYQVKYVVEKSTNAPVSITVDDDNKLVLASDSSVKVEGSDDYKVYTWFMTIHVYDVVSDDVIEYDPKGGTVILQQALPAGAELTWTLSHGADENVVTYSSTDQRKEGILQNDIFRVPLYKAAENPNMGSCADLVGIAYAGSSTVSDISKLKFADTYASRYDPASTANDDSDGIAIASGSGGDVAAALNTLRIARINRMQDHANYSEVSFTPDLVKQKKLTGTGEDVFYYKIVVFAEDNTYQYRNYDDMSALDGVTMYTYFTLKPKYLLPPDEDPGDDPDDPGKDLGDNPGEDPDDPGKDPGDNPGEDPGQDPGDDPGNDSGEEQGGAPDIDPDDGLFVGPEENSYMSEHDWGDSEKGNADSSNIVIGAASPKTGDNNNLALWASCVLFGMVLIARSVSGIFRHKER